MRRRAKEISRMTQLDLATLHEAVAEAVPDRECLVWRDRRLTWRAVGERTRRLANLLHGHGLGRFAAPTQPWVSNHDHMALYLHNGPEYLEGLLGAHKARVAPFNVNYRYVDDELSYLFADARPRAVLYHARFAEHVRRLDLAADVLLLQVADESGAPLLPGALDYEAALASSHDGPVPVQPTADDLHILYTGGTTGMPKGVLWRIGDLLNGPLGLRRRDGMPITDLAEAVAAARQSPNRVLVCPPMMHGSGTWTALGGWCGGAAVVVPGIVDRLDAADVFGTVQRERITRLPIVGDAFARPLVAELEAGAYETGTLRHVLNSGAAINPVTKARLAGLLPGTRIIDVIGSSEGGFQMTRSGAGDAAFKAGPGSGVLSADRTRLLEPGEDELGWLVKSGSIPLGYLNDPGKTGDTFFAIGGRRLVAPGDRARLLADGGIELHGRESTTINTGGEKVFAEEVEAVVRAIAGVSEALVLGRPSERWGSEIVAVVTVREPLTDEELKAACAEKLARYKIPKKFVRTELGLRLPNGKADYVTAKTLMGEP
ncbi:MAG: AMP-binding protein [Streptosporangiaceae bacterium]